MHRRFLTTTWTEDRSALKRLNAKDIAKKLWYSNDILIDQWLYECFSVISSLPDYGGPHLHFTQLLYILVHFYALASHCTYILSCWKIEAYNVLVKFTFSSRSKWRCCNFLGIMNCPWRSKLPRVYKLVKMPLGWRKWKQETGLNLFSARQRIDNISLWVRDNLIYFLHFLSYLQCRHQKHTTQLIAIPDSLPLIIFWSDWFIKMHKTVLRASRIYFKYKH